MSHCYVMQLNDAKYMFQSPRPTCCDGHRNVAMSLVAVTLFDVLMLKLYTSYVSAGGEWH